MQHRVANKLILAGLLGVAFGLVYWKLGALLSLDYLAEREEALRSYGQQNQRLAYLGAFTVYVLVTGLSIPGAVVLTLLYGWFFGFVPAMVLVSFASTLGATVAFWVSRYLLREVIQRKFGSQLQQFNDALERDGPLYLFALRLIPVVPFFVINLVMGLTLLKTSTFWWISQIGMLPGTAVYVYAGASVPSLAVLADQGTGSILTINVATAFLAIGLFPLVVRFILNQFGYLKHHESRSDD